MELLARVYRPVGPAAGPLPAVVDVHGGAWTRLDRTTGAVLGRGLAACGVVVVALDFRMGPDHKHPAASADVAAGLRWVRAHASRLGVDPARVGHRRQLERRSPRLAPRGDARRGLSRGHADHHARRIARRLARRSPAWRSRWWPIPCAIPSPATATCSRARTRRRIPTASAPSGSSTRTTASSATRRTWPRRASTRIVASGEACALPPMWLGQPETRRQRARRHHRRLRRRVSARGRRRSSARTSRAPSTASCRARAGRRRRACALMRDFAARHWSRA